MIDGNTKLMGLLGERISYTLSPRMHNRAAALLGVNATYLSLSMPQADLESFLKTAWNMGALGFNVTTPHKEHVAKLVASSGRRSVNTIYRGPSGWLAASTDAGGLARGIERLGRSLESFSKVVVLGSGGVTLALLEHLATLSSSTRDVVVLRRDGTRDADLISCMPRGFLRTDHLSVGVLTRELADRDASTLLIQATSAPNHGDDLSSLVPALATFTGVVIDLVYGKPSALYRAAVAKKLTTQDGEPMLIEQARLAQELWWGKAVSYEVLADALREK